MSDDPARRAEDFGLLDAWRAGDRTAGSALFERYVPALVRFFRNKASEPEDLVQATFLACVEGRDRFEGRASFRTYLLAIARFQLYAHLRKVSRQPGDLAFDLVSIARITESAGRRIDRRRRHARLLAALQRLSVDEQLILELSYWESLSGPEVAEVMGLSHAAVRVRLHRARQRLAGVLAEGGAGATHAPADDSALDQALRAATPRASDE